MNAKHAYGDYQLPTLVEIFKVKARELPKGRVARATSKTQAKSHFTYN